MSLGILPDFTDVLSAATIAAPRPPTMPSSIVLKTVVFFGSARNITPPWGGEPRAGDRVHKYISNTLASRSSSLGDKTVTHEITCFDPLVVFGEGGALAHSGAHMTAPTFFQKGDDLPQATKDMMKVIKDADAVICVTPEYNHCVSPALASMLNHFGGSNFKCKPSGILTYSPSPFGGARAFPPLMAMLHELGSLPVSKVCHFPDSSNMFTSDGGLADPENRMGKQLPDMLTQVEWMAVAMKQMRDDVGEF
jgi:NAD(P)H-dependent FMN reductase